MRHRAIRLLAVVLALASSASALLGLVIAIAMYSPNNFTLKMYIVDGLMGLAGLSALVALAYSRFSLSIALSIAHVLFLALLHV